MKIKALTIITTVLLLAGGDLDAQDGRKKYYEFGIASGVSTMKTLISDDPGVASFLEEARPMGGVFVKYHLSDWFGLGAEMNYGTFYANDLNHNHPNRGLSARTSMFQGLGFFEVHLMKFGKYHLDDKFSIFLKAGGGAVAYDPEVNTPQKLPDFYQIDPGAELNFGFFGGFGAKYRLGYHSILAFEFRAGNSGGDLMEGVLNTQEDADNGPDTYSTFLLSYSYAIF